VLATHSILQDPAAVKGNRATNGDWPHSPPPHTTPALLASVESARVRERRRNRRGQRKAQR
jgi:hypothetical protein